VDQRLTIEVAGLPAPQGSKTIYRGRLVEASGEKLKKWRKAIAEECAKHSDSNIFLGPVEVEIDFYLPRPASVKQAKRPFPIVPPDVDKLSRACLDGIGQGPSGKSGDGVIWGDDSQVISLIARKHYADDRDPGAIIQITAL